MKDNALKPFKLLVGRYVPGPYRAAQRWWYDRTYGPVYRSMNDRFGDRIAAGPFEGMHYPDRSAGSDYLPKRVGSYESELAPTLAALPQRGYRQVIDVGCAEGYYAVGLARLLPEAVVLAFDTDDHARKLCAETAALNDLGGRVTIDGLCDTTRLNSIDLTRTLIVCDCEGYEQDLLDPALVPGLAGCDVIVELHESFRPGVTALLSGRFGGTHAMELVNVRPRDPAEFAALDGTPNRSRARAIDEGRGSHQQWMVMRSKTFAGPAASVQTSSNDQR